jgi:hypothetical protein
MPAVEEAPAVPATTGTATADSVVAPDTTETSDMISAPAPVSLALPESTETPKVVVDAPHIDAKEEVKEEVKKSPKKVSRDNRLPHDTHSLTLPILNPIIGEERTLRPYLWNLQ